MKNTTPNESGSNYDSQSDHTPTKAEECLILLPTWYETNTYNANQAYGDSL
tara:strand:+ start:585 stop:737 length:153 start_codon:yes stop_codon:yes gene_type:complete